MSADKHFVWIPIEAKIIPGYPHLSGCVKVELAITERCIMIDEEEIRGLLKTLDKIFIQYLDTRAKPLRLNEALLKTR